MEREANIRIYQSAYQYLEQIKPEGIILEDYFYGDDRDYHSLEEVFIRFIMSAQNYQRMPNVIAFDKRKKEIEEILQGYDIQKITEMSAEELDQLFEDTLSTFEPV